MCGIAGVLAKDSRHDVTSLVERLTSAHAHRGPDGSGYRFFRGRSAAFGHRRLSIVDLEGGAQPMSNEDGSVWVVFNGELYNHLDLRRELEALGHRFRTRSDVEAVVHGWEAWGTGILERMNGMYAFALFDGRGNGAGEVWLGRDPAGIKLLYVGVAGDLWWFVSELAAAAAARAGISERHRDLSIRLNGALESGSVSLGQGEVRALVAVLEEEHSGRFGSAAAELRGAVA